MKWRILGLVLPMALGSVAGTQIVGDIGNAEAPTPAVVPAEPPRAYPLGFTAFVSHSNPRALFEQHIKRAVNGDADSMLIVAEVTENCAPIGRFKSWAEYAATDPLVQSGQMPREMEDEFEAKFNRLAGDCSYVNAQMPWDHHFATWAGDWYKKAAAAGNVAARLRILSNEPESDDNRQSMATLLNDSVLDFRIAYLAADFLVKYPLDDDFALAASYRLVGCARDPECNVPAMRRELEADYLPAQVDSIATAAQAIEHGQGRFQ